MLFESNHFTPRILEMWREVKMIYGILLRKWGRPRVDPLTQEMICYTQVADRDVFMDQGAIDEAG